jgi:hypothetical protein
MLIWGRNFTKAIFWCKTNKEEKNAKHFYDTDYNDIRIKYINKCP